MLENSPLSLIFLLLLILRNTTFEFKNLIQKLQQIKFLLIILSKLRIFLLLVHHLELVSYYLDHESILSLT